MSKHTDRIAEITECLKPFIISSKSEDNALLLKDINVTLCKSINRALIQICYNQARRNDITHTMRKYLLGKMYRAKMDEKTYLCDSHSSKNISENLRSQDIAYSMGKDFNISGPSVMKYDLYSRSIDKLWNRKSVSITNILLEIEIIPMENIIKLSKMSDADINYLKILFKNNFYRLAGYVIGRDDVVMPVCVSQIAEFAMIKRMPPHDPDSMINSLSFTIPSWIKSIQKAIDTSNISDISNTACNNLKNKLVELKELINNILIRLEEDANE